MEQVSVIALWGGGFIWLLGFGAFSVVSIYEGERRAFGVSVAIAATGAALSFAAALLPLSIRLFALTALGLLGLVCAAAFLLPVGTKIKRSEDPKTRFDERDIMFARRRLMPGSMEYEQYYSMRPENKAVDDRARAKPGLLSPDAKLADPLMFAAVEGSFFLTEALRDAADGDVSNAHRDLPPIQMTKYLKNLARFYGAFDVGITEIKPYHVYSHIGRGSGNYGEPVRLDHRYAIAFTVEMDYGMVGVSPEAPTTVETGKQYVAAAQIAVQLAAAIRAMGHPARAHIDGNYRVIAPLVARDAGLGEFGRIGLLITPQLGPRVRLGVVTTNLDLVPDKYKPDLSVIDFCNNCTKCARNCPSQSIPSGERQEADGVLRWKIDSNTCFHYWNVIGTDCGRCMVVCPYSHSKTFFHNLIRWGNSKSGVFRRLANWMDDLFYGAKPARREPPAWTKALTDAEGGQAKSKTS